MKVLFVMNSLGTGGAERSTAELLPVLRDEGIEPVIVCMEHRTEGVEEDVLAEGYDVRFLDAPAPLRGPGPLVRASRLAQRVQTLRGILTDEQPAVMHTMLFEASLVGRLAAVGTDVPVVHSVVNTSYEPIRIANDPNLRAWKMEVMRRFEGWMLRRYTTRVHAVAGAVEDYLVERLGVSPEKISVVHRGRHAERLGRRTAERRAAARDALGLADDAEVVLHVGRQEFQKGHEHLLTAARRLLAERPRAVLVLAGRRGNASQHIDAVLEQHPEWSERVHLLGHRHDVPDLMAAADVLAFPSLYEGAAGVLIEALALELPIVASDIPPHREVTDDGRLGWLVPPTQAGALAKALIHALEHPDEGRARAATGRRTFEQRYTHERSTKRMIELYRDVAKHGRQ